MAEVHWAAQVGINRTIRSRFAGKTHENGQGGVRWAWDIDGAVGELAWHKLTDQFWTPSVGKSDKLIGDAPGGVQIRATTRHAGCLILKPEDRDKNLADPFVLAIIVYGEACRVRFPGWLRPAEVADEWWRPVGGGVHHAAWFVPQSAIHPVGEL